MKGNLNIQQTPVNPIGFQFSMVTIESHVKY